MAPTPPVAGTISVALIGVVLVTLSIIGTIIYRLFIHPLRWVPGPLLWRISAIPRTYYLMKGTLPFKVAEIQFKYGPVIRIAPDELVYCDPQAWKDIYGHKSNGAPEFPKDPKIYRLISHLPTSLINADRDEHAIIRRQLSHGFSEKAMREQEPIIGVYVDFLIKRIYENGKNGSIPLNMREWFNWTTFDVIGDLGFGSSFDCLKDSAYHPWVHLITHTIKETAAFQALVYLGFRPVVQWLYRSGLMSKNYDHIALVKNKLQQRMQLGVERPDLIEGLLKKKNEWQMDLEKLAANASLLIIAGSETTATLLSGATFLLTTNPDKLEKLTKEVRSAFQSDDEITLTSVNKLHYMLAVLNESFRRYPPVTAPLPRVVPKGGAPILGKHVAEDTAVSVWQWSINHHPDFWKDPMTFAPERWMDDPAYKGDRLDAMQPFSYGPRNCIGRNLAYAEMRLILAKIIYNFDMSISDDSRNWLKDQKSYFLWDKPSLNIYMTPVARKSG
ncbi:cytochrome P450 [Hypoxylon sp. NC0597]|nr:cytochrome P450 [Hypoxylon sp. NC0597]